MGKKYEYKIPKFNGGLNSTATTLSMPPDQSPDLNNVIFTEQGAVESMPTPKLWVESPLEDVHGLGYYSILSTIYAASGADIYRIFGGAWEKITIPITYQLDKPVRFVETDNVLLIVQQGRDVYAIDRNGEVSLYGVKAPYISASPVYTTELDGTLDGTYKYALTYSNSRGAESDYRELSGTIIAENEQVRISNLQTTTLTDVSKKTLYRALINEDNVYYKVVELDPSDSTYLDNTPDTELIHEAPTDNGLVRQVSVVFPYKGVNWAFGDPDHPNWLYFSNAGSLETFPAEQYIAVGEGDGQKINALSSMESVLLIHRERDLYVLYVGDSTAVQSRDSWYLTKGASKHSAYNQECLISYTSLNLMLNLDGAYILSGDKTIQAAADSFVGKYYSEEASINIKKSINAINFGSLVQGIDYKGRIYLLHTTNNKEQKILIFDYLTATSGSQKAVWSIVDTDAVQLIKINNKLLYIDELGSIYKFRDATNE